MVRIDVMNHGEERLQGDPLELVDRCVTHDSRTGTVAAELPLDHASSPDKGDLPPHELDALVMAEAAAALGGISQELATEMVDGCQHHPEADLEVLADSFRTYLNEISGVPLLTYQEEIELAMLMEQGREAARELESRPSPSEAHRASLEKAIEKGEAARRKMIESNLRLVVSNARKYVGRGMSLSDLIQEGNIGLMRAVDKFDYRKGFKFSTYGTWWIRQALSRALADHGRTIRLPVHMIEAQSKVSRATRELQATLGREPTLQEIGEELGVPADRVREILDAPKETVSLETPVGEDQTTPLVELLADPTVEQPHEAATRQCLKEAVAQMLSTLTPREQRILVLRFGLEDDQPKTLEDIGQEFGVTRERVRQLEAKAMMELRHPSRSLRLKEFLS